MNILAVVAHPDDELLGCGGTLRRLADEGHDVYSVVLCAPADARQDRPPARRLEEVSIASARAVGIRDSLHYDFPNIRFNVVPHLEMVQAIEKAIVKYRPEWIFTHHSGDLNVDHRVCYETTTSAVLLPQRLSHDLPTTMVKRVYLCEIPSSTDWAPPTNDAFRPNSFFDISATLEAKVRALQEFEGALKPYPHSRSAENVRHVAYVRGAQVGLRAAEAFCLVREVNP